MVGSSQSQLLMNWTRKCAKVRSASYRLAGMLTSRLFIWNVNWSEERLCNETFIFRYVVNLKGVIGPLSLFYYLSVGQILSRLYVYHSVINQCFKFTAETEPHEGKRKVESLWPIFRLHHQRSRYIFDLFYKRKAISRGIVVGFGFVVFVLFRDLFLCKLLTCCFHSQSFMNIASKRAMQTKI